MTKISEQDKLYKSLDKDGYVTIKVKFDPLLLSVLGYYNPLKEGDKPNLEEAQKLARYLWENGISI